MRHVTDKELKDYFAISAEYLPGLTGRGGDIQLRHARRDPAMHAIELLTCGENLDDNIVFTELASCPGVDRRRHICIKRPSSSRSADGHYWSYSAEYEERDTEPHDAVAHLSHDGADPVAVAAVVTYSNRAPWFKDESVSVSFSF